MASNLLVKDPSLGYFYLFRRRHIHYSSRSYGTLWVRPCVYVCGGADGISRTLRSFLAPAWPWEPLPGGGNGARSPLVLSLCLWGKYQREVRCQVESAKNPGDHMTRVRSFNISKTIFN